MKDCLKHYMSEIKSLRFVVDSMHFCSSAGRKSLMQVAFMTDATDIQAKLDHTEIILKLIREAPSVMQAVSLQLEQLHDMSPILKNLRSNIVLGDVELFEIKRFTMLIQQVAKLLLPFDLAWIKWQDTTSILEWLNPAKQQTSTFYIYPDYDSRLPLLHQQLACEKEELKRQKLLWNLAMIEDEVRQKLSDKLRCHTESLQCNFDLLTYLDVLLAKARLVVDLHLTKPQINTKHIKFTALFNPEIKELLSKKNHQFQPVDICLTEKPCLITGANMSGKSVMLKTIGLAQLLFQFGFYVPAEAAEVTPVAAVLFSMDDTQSAINGLSSFAVEILTVQQMILKIKSGQRVLALVDELARTTNPEEGKALVNAFLQLLSKYKAFSLTTTHYSGIDAPCRHLRVKGLQFSKMPEKISPEMLPDYMDYTLEECVNCKVPHEALRIADILGVDAEFLALANP